MLSKSQVLSAFVAFTAIAQAMNEVTFCKTYATSRGIGFKSCQILSPSYNYPGPQNPVCLSSNSCTNNCPVQRGYNVEGYVPMPNTPGYTCACGYAGEFGGI
ncbi:hypothetical protein Alg215_11619 [Pyrenophora tritici-repentis]|nr:hypothetical protein Alg215_11619 [Pyrenophora tritici-repentis]